MNFPSNLLHRILPQRLKKDFYSAISLSHNERGQRTTLGVLRWSASSSVARGAGKSLKDLLCFSHWFICFLKALFVCPWQSDRGNWVTNSTGSTWGKNPSPLRQGWCLHMCRPLWLMSASAVRAVHYDHLSSWHVHGSASPSSPLS